MIKLNNVNKYFNKGKKNEIHVIDDTSLELGARGLVALLGPSGSGKTTLLNAIGGLDKIDGGEIYVDGKKISGRSAAKTDEIRNLSIGYIFQDYKLVDNMTVYDNVAMVLRMIGIKDEEEIRKRIEYVLDTLGIYRYRNRMADMLSGGERQRVGIARAIVKNPKIIIADEPTGNLDSANTIEIMNIIKAISRERLVVLVTHEVELAKFYASRIIELKDGKIVADYANQTEENLDYRIDNRLYLKDFEKHVTAQTDGVKVEFYGGAEDEISLKIAVRNGNIYISTEDGGRIEAVDANSAVEFVDDHYREIDKTLYENYSFDFDKVADSSLGGRYVSIIGFLPSLARGFRKIASYPLIKKLLFVGFLLAGAFITYSYSSIFASLRVEDEDFIQKNRDYIAVQTPVLSVEDFRGYEEMAAGDYVFPGSSVVSLSLPFDFYYQTDGAFGTISGSLTDASLLSEEDLILGRLPQNDYELVIDKLSLERMIAGGDAPHVGITKMEQLLGLSVEAGPTAEFTIVGVTDGKQPAIYAAAAKFTDLAYASFERTYYADGEAGSADGDISARLPLWNYETYDANYKLTEGRLPENDYEVLLPADMAQPGLTGKEIEGSVGGRKLTAVGFYELSPEDTDKGGYYLVNENTIRWDMAFQSRGFDVAARDVEETLETFRSAGLKAETAYDADKAAFIEERSAQTRANLVVSLMILAISLIEILLMTRSSFLSRIKEIGIYRAIGVKKTDIYKTFLGEIVAITTVSSLAGIVAASYVLYQLCQIPAIESAFAFGPLTVVAALLTVYAFNAVVGLIPVAMTMRKTPAAILSRHDVD